jgi:hypothetical protein
VAGFEGKFENVSRARLAPSHQSAPSERVPLGSDPKLSTLNKWYRALEGAGLEFIDDDAEHGPGVRLQKGKPPARGSEGLMKKLMLSEGERADATLALMIKRADELVGCTEGSPQDEELRTLTDAIDAYEAKREGGGRQRLTKH